MGLQTDIAYTPPQPNAVQRLLLRLASFSFLSGFLGRVLPWLDNTAHRLSKGRTTVAASLGALPVLLLTTTGARSGQSRTSPLIGVPLEDDLALIGTRFGSGKAPGWAHNLRKHPEALIEYTGRTHDVVAREVSGAEHEEAFAAAISIYPGYAGYRARATNDIPVFVLVAAPSKGMK